MFLYKQPSYDACFYIGNLPFQFPKDWDRWSSQAEASPTAGSQVAGHFQAPMEVVVAVVSGGQVYNQNFQFGVMCRGFLQALVFLDSGSLKCENGMKLDETG